MKQHLLAAATVIALAAAGGTPASAAVLMVGNPANGGNCFPFGCALWIPEYQQVYASSDFAGPITITGLTFYNTQDDANSGLNGGTYTLSLSSTTAAVNNLDLSNLANNVGANSTMVFSGTLPAGPIAPGGSVTITLSTPFTYNPGGGLNLLLDVTSNTPQNVGDFLDADLGNAAGLFSRAMTPGCCSFFSDYGLVTGFDYNAAPAPEPASMAVLAIGLAGLSTLRRGKHTR